MFGVTTSDDYQPVTWVGRHPVHVTTLLVAVHIFLMVVVCFLSALGATGFLGALIFDSAQEKPVAPRADRKQTTTMRKIDRKSTRLNSSHEWISYAVFCLKKKKH